MKGKREPSEAWFPRARRLAVMGHAWASSAGHVDIADRFRILMSVVERVEKHRVRIAIVGPFSAGKTTFLNNWIGNEGFQLPTGVGDHSYPDCGAPGGEKPTTSVSRWPPRGGP